MSIKSYFSNPSDDMAKLALIQRAQEGHRLVVKDMQARMTKAFLRHGQLKKAYRDEYGESHIRYGFITCDSLLNAFIECGYRRELSGHVMYELQTQYRALDK